MIGKSTRLSFILFLIPFVSFASALTGDPSVEKPELYVQNSGSRSLEVDFILPGVQIEKVWNGEEYLDRFYMDGEGVTGKIGAPELPLVTRLFIIPDNAKVIVKSVTPQFRIYQGYSPYPHQEYEYGSPHNTASVEMDDAYYKIGTSFPEKWVDLGTPAIMRDYRVIPVIISPVQVNPVTGEARILTGLHLELEYTSGETENVKTRHFSNTVPTFNRIYEQMLSNYDWINPNGDEVKGTLLIVYPNVASVANILAPLVEWKKRRGYSVQTVSLPNAASTTQVYGAIQSAYTQANPPLESVILIGDANGTIALSCYSMSGGSSDHNYTMLDGTDVMADITLGRYSCSSTTMLQTEVNKVLYYEKNPTLQNTEWYRKGIVCAGSGSGISTIYVNRNIRDWWLKDGFTQVDTMWYTMAGSIPTFIVNQCNSGISALSYRGYAGVSGLSTGQITSLQNTGKLPFATMLTCGTGSFSSGTAISEAWFQAGTPTAPTGGIGGVSTATLSTHTRFNNTMLGGMWFGLHNGTASQLGSITFAGKYELYITYPYDYSNMANFCYWNNLMGDPTTEIWNNIPQQTNVSYPAQLSLGPNNVTITVTSATGVPLPGRYVTLLKGSEVFIGGETDENGVFSASVEPQTAGNLMLTITANDDYPFLADIAVVQSPVFTGFDSLIVDDDNTGASQGNGDGIVNAGETLELAIQLKNYGDTNTATGISAVLSSADDKVTITQGTSAYPNIAVGSYALNTTPYVVHVASVIPDDYILPFTVTVATNEGQFVTGFNVEAVSGLLSITTAAFSGGTLQPGDIDNCTVTLHNSGEMNLTGLSGSIIVDDPDITIQTGTSLFGNIAAGGSISNTASPFVIAANALTRRGKVVPFTLTLTSVNGFTQIIQGQFTVGTISSIDPIGPDDYGYYSIDNTDIEYNNAPQYNWIEISSIGTQVPLSDYSNEQDASARVDLPFTMYYYGEGFNIITVCSNGWIATGNMTYFVDFRNYPIPSALGANGGMLCPFWDNLIMSSGGVYKYYDAANHKFIIEYHNVAHQSGGMEKFQVIIFDPEYYPTPTGDSEILFQYMTVTMVEGPTSDNDYCTVGIENIQHTDGIQYCYWNNYTPGAATLSTGRAIKFTTVEPVRFLPSTDVQVTLTPVNPPINIPASGGSFGYGIDIFNNGTQTSIFDVWTNATLPNGSTYGPIISRSNINLSAGSHIIRNMTQNVPASAPAGQYTYNAYVGDFNTSVIWDQDSFTFTKAGVDLNGGGNWNITGWEEEIAPVSEIPQQFKLYSAYPNPFNPVTSIAFDLPEDSRVTLIVYNLQGKETAVLQDGFMQAGSYENTFDARGLASGVYFIRLSAGNYVNTQKIILMK